MVRDQFASEQERVHQGLPPFDQSIGGTMAMRGWVSASTLLGLRTAAGFFYGFIPTDPTDNRVILARGVATGAAGDRCALTSHHMALATPISKHRRTPIFLFMST